MGNDDRLSVLIVWYIFLYESLDPVGTISGSTMQNLDATCVPVTVSMSHLQVQQVMKSHLSISI
jgi:hypothetical protein